MFVKIWCTKFHPIALFIQLWPEALYIDAREARADFRVSVYDCTVAACSAVVL